MVTHWWLSFVDTEHGGGSLGAAVVEAEDFMMALLKAGILGCNPGGQVAGFPLPPRDDWPPEARQIECDRLYSKAELIAMGMEIVKLEDLDEDDA